MGNTASPTYCIFDGLQWESTRGLGRFAAQLRRHLDQMPWKRLPYRRPRWKSPIGRIVLNEFLEPAWREFLSPGIAFYPHNVLPSILPSHAGISVLVLHDVLFLDSNNRSAGNQYRSLKLKRSLARADLILTVSEVSRIEILKRLDRECPVLVIPNALAQGFDLAPRSNKPKETGPARVIHFGGHAATKNTRNVLKAIAMLNQEGHEIHLDLAAMTGARDLAEQWRQETGLASSSLTILRALSDVQLLEAYANADAHCMPSTGEGFGIPVIEAARIGTPNVLSPLAVFRELIGEDALFTDSLEAEDIAKSLLKCLTSDTREMTQRARQRTDRFLFASVHQTNAVPAMQAVEALAASRHRKEKQ